MPVHGTPATAAKGLRRFEATAGCHPAEELVQSNQRFAPAKPQRIEGSQPRHGVRETRPAQRILLLVNALHTSAECRQLDRIMIEREGLAGFDLMRRAGQAAFDQLMHRWPGLRSVSICCGKGNNAGDGYIIAGLARQVGLEVQLLQVGDASQLRGDAALAQSWAERRGVSATAGDAPFAGQVVVDALLGTGLKGPLREPFKSAVERINASGLGVLAVDVPSGVDADTGAVAEAAVRADVTLSFIGAKLGLHTGPGLALRGELVQAGLGVTEAVLAQVPGCPWLRFDAAQLPALAVDQHKHRMGHLVVVGGDAGMGGAPLMAGEAALRAGTGLVSLLTRPEHHAAILSRRPELMAQDAGDAERAAGLLGRAAAVVVGPGLGRAPWGEWLFRLALAAGKPTVVDADGLRWLAELKPRTEHPLIITPHPGEAAALLGASAAEIEADRPAAALELARRFGSVAVLKGPGTLCAADGLLGLCAHGNPGMATAGMGDVLAGVVGGLLAQGFSPNRAATVGTCLHGWAGDRAAARLGQRGLLATDVIDALAEAAAPDEGTVP